MKNEKKKKQNVRIKKNYVQYKQIRIRENYIQYVQMYPLAVRAVIVI